MSTSGDVGKGGAEVECTYTTEEYKIDNPVTLKEIAETLKSELPDYFHNVDVQVVSCPVLGEAPYNLAFRGLGGDTAIIDIGGLSNLFPIAKQEKIYSLGGLIQNLKLTKNDKNKNDEKCKNQKFCFIGAGEGPHHLYGCSEWICNAQMGFDSSGRLHCISNKSKCVRWDPSNRSCFLKNAENDQFGLMANLFFCNGAEKTPVLKIRVSNRENKKEEGKDFPSLLSNIFRKRYSNQIVSLGGVMQQKKGESRVHVMPDFLKEKMKRSEEAKEWLKLLNISSPLNFVFVSSNTLPDHPLQLRTVHTHGHNDEHGGHYHHDVSPAEVEYDVVCNLASCIYRVDKVSQSPVFEEDAEGKLGI